MTYELTDMCLVWVFGCIVGLVAGLLMAFAYYRIAHNVLENK